MKRVFKGIVSVFMLTVLNVLSLGVHAAAVLPMNMEHSMGSSHQMSSSSCFTSCTTAILYREEVIKNTEEEDDKPQPPVYVQFQTSSILALEEKHNQETRSAIDREPPPDDVPSYIGLAVFRA